MRDDQIADLPLSRLSEMIRNRELTSVGLVERYLDRIERYDKRRGINSFITVAADEALRQAEAADALTGAGKWRGPLHGLPLALKDNIETKGIRTTGGSEILSSWVPSEDASLVKRLKRAGAVILGKTNMHELALGTTTNNPHFGPTRNPYDPTRTPGGSSGGSAAATAAGLCAASIGTDTGGSVRIPAAFCGVVGLKPTFGRVGRGGMIPLSFTRDTVGTLTRTVEDSAMILEVVAGRDRRDRESAGRSFSRWAGAKEGGMKGKRIGLPRRFIEAVVHPDTLRVTDESVALLRDLGAVVREIEIPHLGLEYAADFNVVIVEAVYLLEEYLKRFQPSATMADFLDRMGADVREILGGQAGRRDSHPVPGYAYVRALRDECEKMKAGFKEAMANEDGLIFPTTPAPAPRIGEDATMELNGEQVSTFLTNIRNCLPASVVGYPAASVPAGYSASGLPIGLQIVARPWEEGELIAMAAAFEQASPVRKPPRL